MKSLLLMALFFAPIVSRAGEWTKMDAHTIYFSGLIEPGDFDRFKSILNSKTKLLIVQSQGGLSWEALKIGKLIRDSAIDVAVQGGCYSACANSLFLSGKNKYLSESFRIDQKMYDLSGVVCFHGGSVGRSDEGLYKMKKLKPSYLDDIRKNGSITLFGQIIKSESEFDAFIKMVENTNQEELEFFKARKIDPKILLLHKKLSTEWACPSANGFKKFGVTNINGDIARKHLPPDAKIFDPVESSKKAVKKNENQKFPSSTR